MSYSEGGRLPASEPVETLLVLVGLGATGIAAAYAVGIGDVVLFVLALLALCGQLVGMKRLEEISEGLTKE